MNRTRSSQIWLLGILGLAVLLRLFPMPFAGNDGDLISFDKWIRVIQGHGLFNFYDPTFHPDAWDRTYPPLGTLAFGLLAPFHGPDPFDPFRDHAWVTLLKVFPVLCELALILAVYLWLSPTNRSRPLILLLLAIFPGLIVTTAWWGQVDAAFTLFVVLSLIALNRDKLIAAWLLLGAAILFKQPGVVLLPLLLVVSVRRYGLRRTIGGVVAMAAFGLLAYLPFMLSGPPQYAVSSYLGATNFDAFANLTDNAFNLWHLVASLHKGSAFRFGDVGYSDAQPIFGSISFAQTGLVLMIGFTLGLLIIVWRQAHSRREFIWGAALYLAFFVLPTEVHERYLYPGAVLLVIAISQDARLKWPALIVVLTYSYNIFQVALSYLQPAWNLWPDGFSLLAAVLNCVCLLIVITLLKGPKWIPNSQPN